MKCILLLAAVYSLIFNQWYKDRGTELANSSPLKANPTYVNNQTQELKHKAYVPYFAYYAALKLNR